MSLFLAVLVPGGTLGGQPDFVATEVHQTTEPVYGMAWGEFDPLHEGMEVACLTQSGSVLQLSPVKSGWDMALLCSGLLNIGAMQDRLTIAIGDVCSTHLGNEIVIEGRGSGVISRIVMIFYDPTAGWTYAVLYDPIGIGGDGWGARVGDFDARRPGNEILYLWEGFTDCGYATVFREISGIWGEEIIYGLSGAEVCMDSAVGEFNPDHPGLEIVVVTEFDVTYEILPPEGPYSGDWPRRTIWGSPGNAGWVVQIADVDPCNSGNEIVYGTRYSNSIMISRHNGWEPHDLEILFTGNATDPPANMWDIAVGDVLPQSPGLEILGVDETGSVYLVNRVDGTWHGQVIWQDPDPLYAVVAGEFLPARQGDEILVAGKSGAITMLTLKFRGDFFGDGKVNFQDFAKMACYWGRDEPSVDIAPWPYGDGVVDMLDVAVLTANWLQVVY